jgi:hypothetical protein
MAHNAWLVLDNHFLGNRETRSLQINATFRSFIQGDLSINNYYRKIKGFVDSLVDLGVDVTDHVLVLNILHRLSKNFEHLCAIFTHAMPFLSFQKVLDDLYLEEIQQGIQGVVGHYLHPHHTLRCIEATVILFLR